MADRFLDNEFSQTTSTSSNRQPPGPHVATLDSATRVGARVAPYRDVMAPLGLGDRSGPPSFPSGCWGYLCLRRAESP